MEHPPLSTLLPAGHGRTAAVHPLLCAVQALWPGGEVADGRGEA